MESTGTITGGASQLDFDSLKKSTYATSTSLGLSTRDKKNELLSLYNSGNNSYNSEQITPEQPTTQQQPTVKPTTTETPSAATTTIPITPDSTTTASAPTPTTTTNDISMKVNIEGIMQNKVKIDASVNTLDALWKSIQNQINAISQSWVGPDATAYIEKLNTMAPKVNAAIGALKKISTTYSTALDEIQDNQNKIKNELQ